MLKVLLTSAIIMLLSSSEETKVFICDSENAVAYHYEKNCRGIKQCKHKIIEVTKEKALERKLKLCGWED